MVLTWTYRSSKDFPDAHTLVMHAYNIESADSIVDHLAFHKALCVLLGWNFSMPPDNSKAYQNLSIHQLEANQDDLIMWPPSVLIHNSTTGKSKDGRMEGIGNRAMDAILKGTLYPILYRFLCCSITKCCFNLFEELFPVYILIINVCCGFHVCFCYLRLLP